MSTEPKEVKDIRRLFSSSVRLDTSFFMMNDLARQLGVHLHDLINVWLVKTVLLDGSYFDEVLMTHPDAEKHYTKWWDHDGHRVATEFTALLHQTSGRHDEITDFEYRVLPDQSVRLVVMSSNIVH